MTQVSYKKGFIRNMISRLCFKKSNKTHITVFFKSQPPAGMKSAILCIGWHLTEILYYYYVTKHRSTYFNCFFFHFQNVTFESMFADISKDALLFGLYHDHDQVKYRHYDVVKKKRSVFKNVFLNIFNQRHWQLNPFYPISQIKFEFSNFYKTTLHTATYLFWLQTYIIYNFTIIICFFIVHKVTNIQGQSAWKLWSPLINRS